MSLVKLLMFFVWVFLSTTVRAEESLQATEGQGSLAVFLSYRTTEMACRPNCDMLGVLTLGAGLVFAPLFRDEVNESLALEVNTQFYMAPWGEGKARVGLILEGEKGCGDLDISFEAISKNSVAYELFLPEIDAQFSSVNPTGVLAVGEMIILQDSVRIKLKEDFKASTPGPKSRNCTWAISKNSPIISYFNGNKSLRKKAESKSNRVNDSASSDSLWWMATE